MMTEGGLTVGGGHTVQYIDLVSQECIPKTCMILLTNVIPIHLIKKINARKENGVHTHTDSLVGQNLMLNIYNRILFSHKKEGNPAICDNMDGS